MVFIFQCIGMKNSDPWHTEADYKITRANTWTGKMKDLGPAAKLNMVLKAIVTSWECPFLASSQS